MRACASALVLRVVRYCPLAFMLASVFFLALCSCSIAHRSEMVCCSCWSVLVGIAFLHRTLTIARHGLRGSVAGCMGHSGCPDVRGTCQRMTLQLTCSDAHVHPVVPTISHAGLSHFARACECDSSNETLTLPMNPTELGLFLGRVRTSFGQGMRHFCGHRMSVNSGCSLRALPSQRHQRVVVRGTCQDRRRDKEWR